MRLLEARFSRLLFGESVAVDHVVNGSQADLESLGCTSAVALACIEGVDEARFGEGFDAPGVAFQVFRLGWLFGVEIIEVSQVAGADESVVCMGDGVFQHAVEFADVARP